ncbi:MAG: HipA domain-containing protein [Gammaproteobacteria bacterium]
MNRRGVVWYGDRRVGVLREDDHRVLHFAYDGDWLAPGGFPVSIRLPLSMGEQEVEAHAWFAGLLPEGAVRKRVCRQLQIDPEDDAGLLFAIGEDCAGALSVLPEGRAPQFNIPPPRGLAAEDIETLARSQGKDIAAVSGEPQRFSLAGVQEKHTVIFDGRAYALSDQANPSTHILKFETIARVCFAEFMANDMARRIGLPVVDMEILGVDKAGEKIPYLRIRRFDRRRDDSGRFRRIHQEDLLQALGEPTALKYQHEGGPAVRDVAELLREHAASPVNALSRLRDWQIFNYLVGNGDGHAKNLALLYAPDEAVPALAPFYDLVAIEFLNLVSPGSWSRNMALAIGEQYVPERITRSDWEVCARDLGMPPKRVLARVEELAGELPGIAASARQAFAESHSDAPVYDNLEESVRRRCRWTLNSVFAG